MQQNVVDAGNVHVVKKQTHKFMEEKCTEDSLTVLALYLLH